jgi:hypothetical protein
MELCNAVITSISIGVLTSVSVMPLVKVLRSETLAASDVIITICEFTYRQVGCTI